MLASRFQCVVRERTLTPNSRATKQGVDTYCAASAAIAELVRLGVDAMKAQEQSQGSKPMVCGVGIPILHRHNVLTQPFAATGRV